MKMRFGKHNGEELSEIPTDYLRWVKEKFQEDLTKFNNEAMVKEIDEILAKSDEEGVETVRSELNSIDDANLSTDGFKEPPAF